MFHTTSAPRRTTAAVAVVLTLGAFSLTGCQTSALREQSEPPANRSVQSAPMPREFDGMAADRIADALERQTAEAREIAERFAGLPADRIEEQLARADAQ